MSIARRLSYGERDPYWANVSLLLHGDGANGGANGTIIDSSPNNLTVTQTSGYVYQGVYWSSPFAPNATNGGSGFFDLGPYLTISSNAAFAMGSGAFTIEYWLKHTQGQQNRVAANGAAGYGTNNWAIGQDTSGGGKPTFSVYNANNAAPLLTAASIAVNDGNWHHVAVCRSGDTWSMFVDGTRDATTSNSAALDGGSSHPLTIGSATYTGTTPFGGNLSNFRIVKGVAIYDPTQSAITVPTSPLSSTAETSVLLYFNNAKIIDAAAKTVLTTVGNASISTTDKKFGNASIYFDGTGDYLYLPASNAKLSLGTGEFTIEFWFNTTSGTQYDCFVSNEGSGGFTILINASTNDGKIVVYNGAWGLIHSTSSSYRDGAWHHLALSRSAAAGSMLFLDGAMIGSANAGQKATSFDASPSQPWVIGASIAHGPRDIPAYIDEIRITKGVARYTANFTAPSRPFPNG